MATAVKSAPVAHEDVKTSAYAWYALGLLSIVSVLNYLDRTLI